MEHESASISFTQYQEIIKQAQSRLPKSVTVILLADRGFVHTQLMTMLTAQLGWHYRIRIKSNTWIWRGKWCQPKSFHLGCGEAICLHNVQIHKGEFYGIVHIIIGRNNVNGELWAIVSNEKTTLQTFSEYGLRFDIEENFRSRSVRRLECSTLDDSRRLCLHACKPFVSFMVYFICGNSLR